MDRPRAMERRADRRKARPATQARAALLTLAAVACAAGREGGEDELRGTVVVGATVRSFLLTAPPSARQTSAAPLLLAFHGTGESGAALRSRAGLDAVAGREGWFVAYPDAPAGNWAEGCDCTAADRLGVDDLGFVRTLIDSLAARLPVDRSRVFAAGFSQGGLFVHRLACELGDRVTAVASVAAPMSAELAARCAPGAPVSVLIAQGRWTTPTPTRGRGVASGHCWARVPPLSSGGR